MRVRADGAGKEEAGHWWSGSEMAEAVQNAVWQLSHLESRHAREKLGVNESYMETNERG